MKVLIFLMFIAGAVACNNNAHQDSLDTAKDANKGKADENKDTAASATGSSTTTMPVDKSDADFAVEVANGNMMEVEMGALAKTKATNERVKGFAAMMVTDHTKAGEDLRKIAVSKNITLPQGLSDDAKKELEDLQKKNGTDFDKAYMNMMLDDHKKDVNKFEKAADKCKDPDLKNFVVQTLPVLRTHLDSAKAITNKK